MRAGPGWACTDLAFRAKGEQPSTALCDSEYTLVTLFEILEVGMNLEWGETNELDLWDSTFIPQKRTGWRCRYLGSDFLSLNFDCNTMSKFLNYSKP